MFVVEYDLHFCWRKPGGVTHSSLQGDTVLLGFLMPAIIDTKNCGRQRVHKKSSDMTKGGLVYRFNKHRKAFKVKVNQNIGSM